MGAEKTPANAVSIAYQLPAGGTPPKTWRVTLAIVDAKNPDWIISQFLCGQARTVTPENQGKFTETWNGLDDNFMPVPPGTYGVKGIYMPADKWTVDGEFHSITPRFVTGHSTWLPTPQQWDKPEPFGGDPTNQPLGAVAIGPNGVAVFYYVYLENGLNCPMIDLNKPINYEQFIRAFHSGGAAGGSSVATDGETVWAFSTDGGPKFVYRADQKPFGNDTGANRAHVYRPEGWVSAMAECTDPKTRKQFVYLLERGKMIQGGRGDFVEGIGQHVDKITVLDGESGKLLAQHACDASYGMAIGGGKIFLIEAQKTGRAVTSIPLDSGLPRSGKSKLEFFLPLQQPESELAVDSHGRIYVGLPAQNHVLQYSASGELLRTFGQSDDQTPGSYDPLTLMSPGKLATWTDKDGNDRLIIVEDAGPNRASEWSADGKLICEFPSLQTRANDGYAVDPENAHHVYVPGHQGWLTRFKVDFEKRTWTVDAVWPNVGDDPKSPELDHPQFIRVNGHEYLACGRSNNIYRHEGNRWLLSAAIIREKSSNGLAYFCWNDANGDGKIQEKEYRAHPLPLPGGVFRYHGNQWMDDLSLVAINQGGHDVWRLAPEGFDDHGNPIFKEWKKLLTDPVLESRAAETERKTSRGKSNDKDNANDPVSTPTLDAIHGGNELADRFSSDWAMVDGSMKDGFYVNARGGPNFSANEGSQVKISRYIPDASGGYKLKWRTGREARQRLAEPGEIYGAIHIRRPINGLLSVVDQSRCGVLLFTEDGLYVDTLFPDGRRVSREVAGVYPQPGEFFAGMVFPDTQTGKIYIGMGKYTPMIYETLGWSLKENPVHALETVQKTVAITASQIASAPEIALSVRGGPGAAHLARFAPALGGVSMDGSMAGWESCEPVSFAASKDQTVEVRCLYDPDHLYLRWHARLGAKFSPKPLQPADRIFTHDRLADTLSFYFQSDMKAAAGGPPEGRWGDVRMVFGIFDDNGKIRPVALGMFPKNLQQAQSPIPHIYQTPVGKAVFERVELLQNVALGSKMDDDGQGFVISAATPRQTFNIIKLDEHIRTLANFSATFAGHNKFWWANRDGSASRETYDEPTEARLYPGSWAPAELEPLGTAVVIRNWQILGPFGGPGAEKFKPDPGGKMKDEVRAFCDAVKYPPDDLKVDLSAIYKGEQLTGYWPNPREIRWKPATIAELDTRVILGPSAQTWYGATWIYAPADTEVEFQFQSHPQTFLKYFLNGELVQSGEIKSDSRIPVATRKVTLRKGWNTIIFRGYCIGYPPFRAGLVISAPAEKLWTLKMSPTPPVG